MSDDDFNPDPEFVGYIKGKMGDQCSRLPGILEDAMNRLCIGRSALSHHVGLDTPLGRSLYDACVADEAFRVGYDREV
tara:strand:- start:307 stop:540 length:234 start_codon:yes stop_codon:yes gene_type:complete